MRQTGVERYFGLTHPIGSPEDNVKLLKLMCRARDSNRVVAYRRYRDQVISQNLRFALSVARRCGHGLLPLEDLLQHAAMGLVRACESYNPDRGFTFLNYARWWSRQAVQRAIGEMGRAIRVPVNAALDHARVRRVASRLQAAHGEAPTEQELSHATGLTLKAIRRAFATPSEWTVSLATNVPAFDGEGCQLGEAISDPDAVDPEAALLAKERETSTRAAVAALPPRERTAIQARIGGATLDQAGLRLNVSRERARQLGVRAVNRMRGQISPELRLA